jgi:hypothetical protein
MFDTAPRRLLRSIVLEKCALHGGWSLWPVATLRSAGFSIDCVLGLASPELAAVADRLLDAETRAAGSRKEAVELCDRLSRDLPREQAAPLHAALKDLRAGRVPAQPPAEAAALLRGLRDAVEAAAAAARDAEPLLARELGRIDGELKGAAGDPRFREALTWQNRRVIETALAPLQRHQGPADNKARQHQQLVASYRQRYSLKNDTIGFFGPTGWARLRADGPALTMTPGPSLLRRRTVYFEHWAIDSLAQTLSEPLLPLLAPRLMPSVRLDGEVLFHPIDKRRQLPPAWARLLGACDGVRSARDIAAALVAEPELGFESEDDVYAALSDAVEKRFLSWGIDVPTQGPFPERALRRVLEGLDDEEARRALGRLDALEARRGDCQRAGGDPVALDRALAALDAEFTEATGRAASRRAGQAYAGRALVYEDTVRDVELSLGAGFVERLAGPLSLLLHSARWATHAVANGYREALGRIHAELCAETGATEIDFLRFRARALDLFPAANVSPPTRVVADTGDTLRSRWAELLRLTPDVRRIERSADELRDAVLRAFPAPAPGWPEARFQQPDLMVAARDADAFARGEFEVVLGELHFSMASVLLPASTKENPDPDALFALRRADLPLGSVAPVEPKEAASPRTDYCPLGAGDVHVELGATRSWLPREQVAAAAELTVARRADRLEVRTRDGSHAWDVIAFFEQQLIGAINLITFGVVPPWEHCPRVTIDGVVVSRERWRHPATALTFAQAKTPLERFVGARRWARERGLPRWLFVKVPEEPKPCFVDLTSPVYIEQLAKQVRKASTVTLSEMLPSLDQTWLVDAEGRRYTSELRLVAVDPVSWVAS